VACASLWFRRRWPVQLAIAITPVSAVAASTGGATLIMVFTVAVHRRFPAAAAIAAANIVAAGCYYWLHPPQDSSWAASFVFTALVIIVAVIWGMFVRARRQLVLSLQARARQAESEAQLRIEQAQQRERQRIAREMHDVLAHRLSLLSVHANALVHRRDAPPEVVAKASTVIRESAHQALEDLREIIGVLRAPSAPAGADEPQPTLADLPTLIEESRRAGMQVAVDDWREGDAPLQAAVDRCAYRVVQEGLTNARKHAPGAPVSVALAGMPGVGLTVNVRNSPPADSAPAGSIPGTGTGLVGLTERVGLTGGTLTFAPSADGGYALTADLPWAK
jgi:signal transduction histidine kinase